MAEEANSSSKSRKRTSAISSSKTVQALNAKKRKQGDQVGTVKKLTVPTGKAIDKAYDDYVKTTELWNSKSIELETSYMNRMQELWDINKKQASILKKQEKLLKAHGVVVAEPQEEKEPELDVDVDMSLDIALNELARFKKELEEQKQQTIKFRYMFQSLQAKQEYSDDLATRVSVLQNEVNALNHRLDEEHKAKNRLLLRLKSSEGFLETKNKELNQTIENLRETRAALYDRCSPPPVPQICS